MGLTKEDSKITIATAYNAAAPFLRKQNGNYHVMYFYLTGQMIDRTVCCDGSLTVQANELLLKMQADGYEIIDTDLKPIFKQEVMAYDSQMYLFSVKYK